MSEKSILQVTFYAQNIGKSNYLIESLRSAEPTHLVRPLHTSEAVCEIDDATIYTATNSKGKLTMKGEISYKKLKLEKDLADFTVIDRNESGKYFICFLLLSCLIFTLAW